MQEYELTAELTETVESLHAFLMDEDLHGVRITTESGVPEAGELGALELITIAMTSGTGIALARAVNTWARSRQQRIKLRLRRKSDNALLDFESSGPGADAALKRFLDHDVSK